MLSRIYIMADKYDKKKRIRRKNKQINKFIARIWKSESDMLIQNYENQIEEIEKEKIQISEKL